MLGKMKFVVCAWCCVPAQVFTLFRAFLYAYGGVCAAKVLHKKLFHSILRAPTAFFDVTPVSHTLGK